MNSITAQIQTATDTVFDLLDVSDATKKDYLYRLPVFINYIQHNGLNDTSYIQFKRHLKEQPYAVSTKNKYLIIARIFLKEMHRQGLIPRDITQNTKMFRQNKQHKQSGLSEREVRKLVHWLNTLPDNPNTDRLKALTSLLLLQGLRSGEVCRLDVEDLRLDEGVAYVLGKGRDDKEPVLLMPQTVEVLRRYLRTNCIKEGAAFRSNSHSQYGRRLSTRGLREIMTDILRRLGIRKTVHGMRHYFTTQLIKAMPGQLLDIALFTRHRSLEMLRVYDDRVRFEASSEQVFAAFEDIEL